MNTMMDCKTCRSNLPDMLLEPGYAAAHPELQAHMQTCAECRVELEELQATFALLDGWEAPEPSPYFDSRLKARLREAAEAEPEGFWERAKAWLQFSSGRSFRPALAAALAVVVIAGAGGGAYLELAHKDAVHQPTASAAVDDLKILDNNAQALQQMDQLLDSQDDNDTPTT